jgi:beta-glucanase (GH16 family)
VKHPARSASLGALGVLILCLVPSSVSDREDPGAPTTTVSHTCDERFLKADGTPWVCTFDDEFDGTELDRSRWVPQVQFTTGPPDSYACYRDDPDNIAVADGSLDLTVRQEDTAAPCPAAPTMPPTSYTAGMVTTYYHFSQQYGRFEARVKVAATREPGLQEDFWLWPDVRVPSGDTWPAAGEIDVVETYSSYPDLAIPFLHYTATDNGGPVPGTNTARDCPAARGVWNTYTLEWAPDRLQIWVNGRSCLLNTSGDAAFQKPYILALTAALGVDANAYRGGPTLPATMSVDYVRVWR